MRAPNPIHVSAFVAVVSLLCLGCGTTDDGLVQITGTITLDGKPLKQGKITIEATDGRGGVEGGTIVDGTYSVKTTPGSKAVKINAPKVIGQKKTYDTPDSPTTDVVTESIPKKYNQQTELKMEVSESSTEHIFELQSR